MAFIITKKAKTRNNTKYPCTFVQTKRATIRTEAYVHEHRAPSALARLLRAHTDIWPLLTLSKADLGCYPNLVACIRPCVPNSQFACQASELHLLHSNFLNEIAFTRCAHAEAPNLGYNIIVPVLKRCCVGHILLLFVATFCAKIFVRQMHSRIESMDEPPNLCCSNFMTGTYSNEQKTVMVENQTKYRHHHRRHTKTELVASVRAHRIG